MDKQKQIDKILEAVKARIQDEVGGLLGVPFSLIPDDNQLVYKEDAFSQLKGKQICARMEISGDVEGRGCLLIGIKDAIRLGGTLIMLPSSELEEVIGREEYGEEVEDSYGEIANIVAGAFTKDFEELYPKSCRFVRKEHEIIVPAKVSTDSDEPVENQLYYRTPYSMVLDGHQMGELIMLLPADQFELKQDDTLEDDATSVEPKEVDPGEKSPSGEYNSESESGADEAGEEGVTGKEGGSRPPTFNVEKHRKRIDKILTECQKKMESELGTLLAAEVTLLDLDNKLVTKEDFFKNEVVDRQVLTDMEVVGDREDKSYFSIGLTDAIHLGGVLIMLPPSELENVVNEGEFGEDARDAYGEVANIISGIYTATFEEQYSEKLRFIRKEFQEVVPEIVSIESDVPIPDKMYYGSSMSLVVNDKQLGKVQMLFPADMLQLQTVESKIQNSQEADQPEHSEGISNNKSAASSASSEIVRPKEPSADAKKHRKRVDKILATCQERVADEVGVLLGTDVKLNNLRNKIVSKEEFFGDEVSGKQVIANLDMVGELEGKSYLSVDLRDAIRIGGELIMLPASELESTIADESLGEDTQDAYSEISNIISGVYSAVFEEQYIKQVRFVKTDLQEVVPTKVDIGSVEPIADQQYYLSQMDLVLGGDSLGTFNMLFPADLLQLGGSANNEGTKSKEESLDHTEAVSVAKGKAGKEYTDFAEGTGSVSKTLDILLIGDDEVESAKIENILSTMGYSVQSLTFKDNFFNHISGEIKVIYLVMKAVNEQAFGAAIKISSSCSLPLVAAGPGWTRTKVIKAVKYGVRDILLTPATNEEVEESVTNNLLKLAA